MAGKGTKKERGDTRRRIQDVALELFVRNGYEKTSLREIAEILEVSKPAIYYHFKSKEDILLSIFQDLSRPVDDIISWGRQQPRNLETKQEILRRYSAALEASVPLVRFLRENEATLRDLKVGKEFGQQMTAIGEMLTDSDTSLTDQLRCMSALLTLHFGTFALPNIAGDAQEKRSALLEITMEMVAAAHPEGA
ncbi:TetR/AcrR family transcriptional regulator [Streptomyces sp. BHT-5-2]|uniref:TetR/AcrR family transcriptional regulator n=1 Tax=unclassified Streptomyces TaxID=2593676 RepID=UPI001C8D6AC1|nr:TetR family transcriptional regulator [Streptomyces sp. BHT-5-2]QZL03658.1 TetR/AcrR family transcriptional regulator [Streptomyces sp. BHT-5-2]